MFSQNMSVLAFSVCILLTMANTSYGYLVLPRQGRSDNQVEPLCCGMPVMKTTSICPVGMECCPGLNKVLQKSGQKTLYFTCVANLY